VHAAPSTAHVRSIDSYLPARDRAERRWAPQTPANRLHRRQQARRRHVVDAQIAGLFLGALIAALILPSWWAVLAVLAGYVVPALTGAWLDTYRPVGRAHRPRPLDLAIATQLNQGETE
jgi:hypothetical protein